MIIYSVYLVIGVFNSSAALRDIVVYFVLVTLAEIALRKLTKEIERLCQQLK